MAPRCLPKELLPSLNHGMLAITLIAPPFFVFFHILTALDSLKVVLLQFKLSAGLSTLYIPVAVLNRGLTKAHN